MKFNGLELRPRRVNREHWNPKCAIFGSYGCLAAAPGKYVLFPMITTRRDVSRTIFAAWPMALNYRS